MKKALSFILLISFLISMGTSVAHAAESNPPTKTFDNVPLEVIDETLFAQPTSEKETVDEENSNDYIVSPDTECNWDNLTTKEALKIIATAPKNYIHPVSGEITVDDVVSEYYNKYGVMPTANTAMTHTSGEMKTGTPGVYWSVKVTFVLGQKSNGAYYFKSISSGSITIHKHFWQLLWATYVGTTTRNRYHSIVDSGNSIKMETTIDYEVYSSATITPITYTENHSTKIPVTYVTP